MTVDSSNEIDLIELNSDNGQGKFIRSERQFVTFGLLIWTTLNSFVSVSKIVEQKLLM